MSIKSKTYVERASLLGDSLISSDAKAVLVLACTSNDFSYKDVSDYKHLSCECCNTNFISNIPESFCPNCGDETPNDIGYRDENGPEPEKALEHFPDYSELGAVECPDCHNFNIVTKVTAGVLNPNMHCIVCGTEIQDFEHPNFPNPFNEQTQEFLSMAPIGTQREGGSPRTNGRAPVPISRGVEDSNDLMTQDVDFQHTPVMAMLELAGTDSEPRAERVGNNVVIFMGNHSVAVLEKASVSKEALEIFKKPQYIDSVNFALSSQPVETVISSFGFSALEVKMPFSNVVKTQVDSQLSKVTAGIKAKQDSYTTELSQCLSISAAGLTKNFFRGIENPLKSALYDELSSRGVREPEAIIDRVFSSFGDSYNKTLLEKALELMTKAPEIRNSLSEAIQDTNYQFISASTLADSSIDIKLETAGTQLKPSSIPPTFIVESGIKKLAATSQGSLFRSSPNH